MLKVATLKKKKTYFSFNEEGENWVRQNVTFIKSFIFYIYHHNESFKIYECTRNLWLATPVTATRAPGFYPQFNSRNNCSTFKKFFF